MKSITFQRAIKFLLNKRTVDSYARLTGKNVVVNDVLGGVDGWCDFVGQEEWGECCLAFQHGDEAKFCFQNLFRLEDIPSIEQTYNIKIDAHSLPSSVSQEVRTYSVDTASTIKANIKRKLESDYPFSSKGYRDKGTLIIGIFDPAFGGFESDIELNKASLDKMTEELCSLFKESSFQKVILVDAMTPFDKDSKNRTYLLLK